MQSPRTFVLIVLSFLVGASSVASAQSPQGGPVQSGPLVLSPVSTAIVFAPDAKVTTINNTTAVLAGLYAGKLIEERVLVGAGAYWLADHRDDARLWYAGLMIGARVWGSDRLNVSARSLFGVGEGTAFDTVHLEPFQRHHGYAAGGDVRIGYRDHFLVVDPEMRLMMAITEALSLNIGAGYRATTAYDGLNELMRGATGSVGLQFNIGK